MNLEINSKADSRKKNQPGRKIRKLDSANEDNTKHTHTQTTQTILYSIHAGEQHVNQLLLTQTHTHTHTNTHNNNNNNNSTREKVYLLPGASTFSP